MICLALSMLFTAPVVFILSVMFAVQVQCVCIWFAMIMDKYFPLLT